MSTERSNHFGQKVDLATVGDKQQFFRDLVGCEYSDREKQYWSDVWGKEPPDLIVLATSSVRKGYLTRLNGLHFDFSDIPDFLKDSGIEEVSGFKAGESDPIDFQHKVEEHIRNGDGFLKRGNILVLGKYHGVTVIVEPQTGEDHSNESALEQSRKKVKSVTDLDRYAGLKVLTIASDTVGSVAIGDKAEIKLGKPRNLEGQFPKPEDFQEEEYSRILRMFGIWYLMSFFTDFEINSNFHSWLEEMNKSVDDAKDWLLGKITNTVQASYEEDRLKPVEERHYNAVVANWDGHEISHETVLTHTLSQDEQMLLAWAVYYGVQEFFLESAGAGLFQTRFPLSTSEEFEDPKVLLESVTDQELRIYLEKHPEKIRPWILLLHIMGVPVWAHAILGELYKKQVTATIGE